MERSLSLGNAYDPLTVAAPKKGDVFLYQDGLAPYLKLRVTIDSRIWQFDKSVAGRHLKRKIGNASLIGVPEARLRAFEWARQCDDGLLPPTVAERLEESQAKFTAVERLFEKYHEKHLVKNCATHAELKRGFDAYWDGIRGTPIYKLTPESIRQWSSKLRDEKGRATANKQLTSLRACLHYSDAHGWTKNAGESIAGVKLFKSKKTMNVLKAGAEVQRLKQSLSLESQDVQDAVWLCLLTGQRKSNVLGMQWNEIDPDSRIWVIPSNKTKTDRQYHVALTDRALEIISRRADTKGSSSYVFANRYGGHLKYINKAWIRVRSRAGLDNLRIHDLRHTAATWLARSGANAFIVQQAMQHASIKTSAHYVHVADETESVRDHMTKAQEAIDQAPLVT